MGQSMRLRAIRSLDDDHLRLDFETDDGECRSFEVTYERSGDPPIEFFNIDAGFRDYLTVPVNGWPDGIDFMDFRDLLGRFRISSRVEWAIGEPLRELEGMRAAALRERWEQAMADHESRDG